LVIFCIGRSEPEFIREIIERVNSIQINEAYFQVAQHPIRMESRVHDVKLPLDIEKNDCTCMAEISGTCGIGKTTIAKAIYNSMTSKFEFSCFLEKIRETSSQNGLFHLPSKLLRSS
jgi:ABC-type glutathione transport system ATPase component